MLLPNQLVPPKDKELNEFKNKIDYNKQVSYKEFINKFKDNLNAQTSNKLLGIDAFSYQHVQTGCDQYIQNLILKHTINGISIFENDYYWYKMVYPNKVWDTWDTLTPDKPLLMAVPFPGHLDVHPYLDCIIDICDYKGIDVHLDCAWLPSTFDIKFNFDRPCIKSFAISLSKCYSLEWSRVGIRWQRTEEDNDPITYENKRNEFNHTAVSIGYQYLNEFPLDYLVHKNKDKIKSGKIIHGVSS